MTGRDSRFFRGRPNVGFLLSGYPLVVTIWRMLHLYYEFPIESLHSETIPQLAIHVMTDHAVRKEKAMEPWGCSMINRPFFGVPPFKDTINPKKTMNDNDLVGVFPWRIGDVLFFKSPSIDGLRSFMGKIPMVLDP